MQINDGKISFFIESIGNLMWEVSSFLTHMIKLVSRRWNVFDVSVENFMN